MTFLFAFLQTWHELDFNLGSPEDIEAFPWSGPVSVLILAGLFFFLQKGRRNYMKLPELPLAQGEQRRGVTVVIPARNEERNIAACVASLRGARVIVVDDASSDKTAAAARAAGAEVVAAPPLPSGAMGKPNAMVAGERLAETDFVFFTDAKARFQPGFLESAERYAGEKQSVLLSAFLKQKYGTLFELLLVPYAFGLYFSGVSAKRLHDVNSPQTVANGACMLFLRSAHEFFGGYQSVHTSQLEDVAIAQKVKRHRMTIEIMRAEHLGQIRMFNGFGAIRRSVHRRAFRMLRIGAFASFQVILTSLLLMAVPPVAVWLARQEQWAFLPFLLLVPAWLFRPWYGGFFKALLYLPAIFIFQLIAFEGVVAGFLGLKTNWKGRKV